MKMKGFDLGRDGQALEKSYSGNAAMWGGSGRRVAEAVVSQDEVIRWLTAKGYSGSSKEVDMILEAEIEMARKRGWIRCPISPIQNQLLHFCG